MKAGAIDFLEKLVAEQDLFGAIRRAIRRSEAAKFQQNELTLKRK
jgi:FixJ family two-component response regulator